VALDMNRTGMVTGHGHRGWKGLGGGAGVRSIIVAFHGWIRPRIRFGGKCYDDRPDPDLPIYMIWGAA